MTQTHTPLPFPMDGSTFVVESIDRTAYRWAKYKPDGARQMGKLGRWQKQVWHGDFLKWENCEEPIGEIAPATGDGPITKAFKDRDTIASQAAEIARLREALEEAEETLGLVQHKAFPDPAHHETVKALGKRIGFGALMSTAEAGWREVLEETGAPSGGEFVSGPCRATVDNCLAKIRAALEPRS